MESRDFFFLGLDLRALAMVRTSTLDFLTSLNELPMPSLRKTRFIVSFNWMWYGSDHFEVIEKHEINAEIGTVKVIIGFLSVNMKLEMLSLVGLCEDYDSM